MAAVGKHFPGHGHVAADSHIELPVDERPLAAIAAARPRAVRGAGRTRASRRSCRRTSSIRRSTRSPPGYSRVWLQDILRGRLGFDGLIFSDDLGMAGAHGAGDIVARADAAIGAGCDMVLACNDFAAMDDLLSRWQPPAQPDLARRWARMALRA